ncbi:MAG: hypothetical protein VW989_04500, partial [Rhodobiaceae bacterium]
LVNYGDDPAEPPSNGCQADVSLVRILSALLMKMWISRGSNCDSTFPQALPIHHFLYKYLSIV